MPLSWNEIRDRSLAFSREWADECSEDAEAKSCATGSAGKSGEEKEHKKGTTMTTTDLTGYNHFLQELKSRIQTARTRTALAVTVAT
jgi:hypothetical protein